MPPAPRPRCAAFVISAILAIIWVNLSAKSIPAKRAVIFTVEPTRMMTRWARWTSDSSANAISAPSSSRPRCDWPGGTNCCRFARRSASPGAGSSCAASWSVVARRSGRTTSSTTSPTSPLRLSRPRTTRTVSAMACSRHSTTPRRSRSRTSSPQMVMASYSTIALAPATSPK